MHRLRVWAAMVCVVSGLGAGGRADDGVCRRSHMLRSDAVTMRCLLTL